MMIMTWMILSIKIRKMIQVVRIFHRNVSLLRKLSLIMKKRYKNLWLILMFHSNTHHHHHPFSVSWSYGRSFCINTIIPRQILLILRAKNLLVETSLKNFIIKTHMWCDTWPYHGWKPLFDKDFSNSQNYKSNATWEATHVCSLYLFFFSSLFSYYSLLSFSFFFFLFHVT